MRIGEDEQKYRDFDWYCVDAGGRVGHFASAGFKELPSSVAESAEDLSFLNDFFNELTAVHDGLELDEQLTPERRTERYLHSFVAMADRGLFSFDIESYVRPEICYFRVAMPKNPIGFADLPNNVRAVLGRTILKEHSLAQSSAIPYSATLRL
jgi:hypothetical protein